MENCVINIRLNISLTTFLFGLNKRNKLRRKVYVLELKQKFRTEIKGYEMKILMSNGEFLSTISVGPSMKISVST